MTAINSNSTDAAFGAATAGATQGQKGALPALRPLFEDGLGAGQAGWKAVYTIVDRGAGKRQHFVRIGVAFVNRDGSLNVKLDAVPCNGQLHIRDTPPRDREQTDAFVGDRDHERLRNREVNAPF